MRAHPFADRFPMLGTEELERLAADIAENGLQHPIVLDIDGRILDGRNRWAACEIAGVTPETVLYEGDDLAAFVLSANVARRHLTTGQQAMSTALVLVDAGKRENGRFKRGAVLADPQVSNWSSFVARAGMIIDFAPELAEQVVEGSLALDAAYREAEKARDAQRAQMDEQERIADEEEAHREHLEREAPEYLEKYPSARQAFAAWEDDHRKEAARLRLEKAEQEREAAQLRDARSKQYTGIGKALQTINVYGKYESIDALMEHYDPSLLSPASMAAEFTVESLRAGAQFIQKLIEWKETQ